jgi:hypothetical protein
LALAATLVLLLPAAMAAFLSSCGACCCWRLVVLAGAGWCGERRHQYSQCNFVLIIMNSLV